MHLHPTLQRDIDAIKPDAAQRLRPGVDHDVSTDLVIQNLKDTFEIYGVDYNEETLQAAAVALIMCGAATQDMFLHAVPDYIEQSPLSYAVHGPLVTMHVIFNAIENFKE